MKGRTKLNPKYLQVPYFLLEDTSIKKLDTFVYATILWLTKMRKKKCFASNEVLAGVCHSTEASIKNCLHRLEKEGYIERIFADPATRRHRIEIIPLRIKDDSTLVKPQFENSEDDMW